MIVIVFSLFLGKVNTHTKMHITRHTETINVTETEPSVFPVVDDYDLVFSSTSPARTNEVSLRYPDAKNVVIEFGRRRTIPYPILDYLDVILRYPRVRVWDLGSRDVGKFDRVDGRYNIDDMLFNPDVIQLDVELLKRRLIRKLRLMTTIQNLMLIMPYLHSCEVVDIRLAEYTGYIAEAKILKSQGSPYIRLMMNGAFDVTELKPLFPYVDTFEGSHAVVKNVNIITQMVTQERRNQQGHQGASHIPPVPREIFERHGAPFKNEFR
jgi:hypothetical protein